MGRTRGGQFLVMLMLSVFLFCFPDHASAQYFVDCSGNTPGAPTTINSVLPLIGNGAMIQVVGTCNENVTLNGLSDIWMGAPWGQTMNLTGSLMITQSENVFLYGMNVSGASGDGITVEYSQGVELDACTSTNNSNGRGLYVDDGSSVSVQNTGNFSNNGNSGIYVAGNSFVAVSGYGGTITVNNNLSSGVYAERSVFNPTNISITNNQAIAGSTAVSGFGVDFRGGAQSVFVSLSGQQNVIQGNQNGGISMMENAEISLCCGDTLIPGSLPTLIVGNGPVGISVGFGSQLTVWDGTQITNHADTGIEVFAHSQAYLYGANVITNNGTGASYPARAGMRVDGNSEAYLRGGQISQNGGPGILALVNSSLDFTGVTFSSNTKGPVECDSSSYMVSDLPSVGILPGLLLPCMTPNNFGNRSHAAPVFHIPDVSQYKAKEAKYQQLMAALY